MEPETLAWLRKTQLALGRDYIRMDWKEYDTVYRIKLEAPIADFEMTKSIATVEKAWTFAQQEACYKEFVTAFEEHVQNERIRNLWGIDVQD